MAKKINDAIANYTELHKGYWRDKPQWYWMGKLLGEVLELFFSLLGLHKHTPEFELRQIASICANWLDYRDWCPLDDDERGL